MIFDENFTTIDLVCDTIEECETWVLGLQTLMNVEQNESVRFKRVIEGAFRAADKNGDERLNQREIYNLLATLNIKIERKILKKLIVEADKDGNGVLDLQEFVDFYQELRYRKEVKLLYTQLNKAAWSTITTGALRDWLTTTQGIHFASDREVLASAYARCINI